MDNPSRRKIPLRFIISHIVSYGQEWPVVQHKKFPQNLTRTKQKKSAETKSYGEKATQ